MRWRAEIAVYCTLDVPDMEVWDINPDGTGTEAIIIPFAELAAQGSAAGWATEPNTWEHRWCVTAGRTPKPRRPVQLRLRPGALYELIGG